MNENKNSLAPFTLGLLAGAGLVFFLATKRGRTILERLLEDKEGTVLKVRDFLADVEREEKTNGESQEAKEYDHIKDIQEKGRLFGHRFFRKKKPL